MTSASEALGLLRDGNRRFVEERPSRTTRRGQVDRSELSRGQTPFAAILGCSDSRVPAEMVFDQGLGDLFIIRVAGNVVGPTLTGSIEYAAEMLDTRLIVVLGHSGCGAVGATIDQLLDPREPPSSNLRAILDRIQPSVEPLLDTELRENRSELLRFAVRANIRASADALRRSSAVLERLIREEELLVVGAEYDLHTGMVDFFDGVPSGE